MRVITWNINSVRLRIDLLRAVVDSLRPDVVCLQETKVQDPQFPYDACRAMGFAHMAVWGQKSYNGVAILSRQPLDDVQRLSWCGKDDCRHLAARVAGIEIHSLYIPAGGDIPDPEQNDKFAHKLAFLDQLTAWSQTRIKPAEPVLLAGDFNIAPLETDVWSHKQLLGVVSHTPVEVEKLTRLQQAGAWVDAVRHFIAPEQRLYSWWSYRNRDWAASDRGRRLDHVWVTPALRGHLQGALVAREVRDWAQPSDHVPVMVDLHADA